MTCEFADLTTDKTPLITLLNATVSDDPNAPVNFFNLSAQCVVPESAGVQRERFFSFFKRRELISVLSQ